MGKRGPIPAKQEQKALKRQLRKSIRLTVVPTAERVMKKNLLRYMKKAGTKYAQTARGLHTYNCMLNEIHDLTFKLLQINAFRTKWFVQNAHKAYGVHMPFSLNCILHTNMHDTTLYMAKRVNNTTCWW